MLSVKISSYPIIIQQVSMSVVTQGVGVSTKTRMTGQCGHGLEEGEELRQQDICPTTPPEDDDVPDSQTSKEVNLLLDLPGEDQVDLCRCNIVPKIKRKVQFMNDKDLVQVREFEDDDESKQNRRLFWEFYAVDRFRFKELVHRTEAALGSIFSPEHRDRIYSQRIAPFLDKLPDIEMQEKQSMECHKDLNSQSNLPQGQSRIDLDLEVPSLSQPESSPSTSSTSSQDDHDPVQMECQINSELSIIVPCSSCCLTPSTSTSVPALSLVSVVPCSTSSSKSSCCLLHILNHAVEY